MVKNSFFQKQKSLAHNFFFLNLFYFIISEEEMIYLKIKISNFRKIINLIFSYNNGC